MSSSLIFPKELDILVVVLGVGYGTCRINISQTFIPVCVALRIRFVRSYF